MSGKKKLRVCIFGSRKGIDRNWNRKFYEDMDLAIERILLKYPDFEKQDILIVSGGAQGIDSLGLNYAIRCKLPCKLMKPDWENEGRAAGFRRNERMAMFADVGIMYWDGASAGTAHMFRKMSALGKLVWGRGFARNSVELKLDTVRDIPLAVPA